MNYRNQPLRELLAGEYVLGLLRGAARRRFERLLMEDGRLRAEVTFWEERFTAWAMALAPVTPSAAVWRRIKKGVAASDRRAGAQRFRRLAPLWAGAIMASVVVLVVGIYAGRSLVTPPAPASYVAVMANPQVGPRWLISVNAKSGRVDMNALADNTPPPGKSYELWMLPTKGKPVSMGLMNPTGHASETLGPQTIAALAGAKGLAISLEPAGGSPTGQPTGPVVYTANIVAG
ncbi:MAG TPA: anti-sigma factor [Gammaproteobacteria bacterium]|nr:anti-sigma factor [Gammaproteobacteria bacterium]